jgi:hypothetical protein
MNSYCTNILTFASYEFLLYMNSYIQSNTAGATDTAHFTSCVSTLDESEDNMNASPGDKKTDEEEETALDVAEGNIQKKGVVSVLGCFCMGNGYIVLHAVCPACRSDTFCNVLPFCIRQNVLTMNASISPFISN